MAGTLEVSYGYCHGLMRRAARNFYYGMRLLPAEQRGAMYALYSYMRLCDDIADDAPGGADDRRERLEEWRKATHAAIGGRADGHPIWPAFCDMVVRFGIPAKVFDDAIDGQIQDLRQDRYGTFAELYEYCYRVASTVGIAAVHIWGYTDPGALKLAEELGIAMQLTNILRDLREDAARGRRYLPDEDCRRFGVEQWMANGSAAPAGVGALLEYEARRAMGFYERSAGLERMISSTARPTLRIMTGIYRGILDRIIASPQRVLRQRVSLSGMRKLWLVARHSWAARLGKGG